MLTQTMIFGIILSLLCFEWIGLSPGGIIVPGYLVLYLNQPDRILSTIFIALLVWGAGLALRPVTILYGRRKFGFYILLGILFNWLFSSVIHLSFLGNGVYGIGLLIPGIIALDFERQGMWTTLAVMGLVIGLLYLFIIFQTTFGVLL